MNKYLFLKTFIELQRDIVFDQIIRLKFADITYSIDDKSVFWNYALTNQILYKEEINIIKNKYISLKRTPTIYFINSKKMSALKQLLEKYGYKKSFEDSWMFYEGNIPVDLDYSGVKKVKSRNELYTFLKTFDKCYQENDPQNPYGRLGNYLKSAENSWFKNNKSNKLEYFIIYNNQEPVAVSALTSYKGIGYISNIGSVKKVRGQGFGRMATLYCVNMSRYNGNGITCLATEEGTYPNEFYKRIGFTTLFTANAYSRIIR